jgi:hypothetical protein
MFEIEKNVPIFTKHKKEPKYPFNEMEVGDSFLVTTSNEKEKFIVRAAAYAFAKYQNKKTGGNIKFKTASVENGDVRVWRIL